MDQINAMLAAGEKPAGIARKLGVARSSIYRVMPPKDVGVAAT
jgi:Helix-turn-helix domain of resolvase